MRRTLKAPPEAGFVHVMNRAAPGDAGFDGHAQARAFVAALAAVAAGQPCDVHAYAVLPRHYHVLLRASPPAVHAAVAQLESESSFPADRAPCIVSVRRGRQLLEASRYVHLNPVTAGLAADPEGWPHSSFAAYLGASETETWVVTAAVLGRFGVIGARHRYRAYVQAGLAPGTRDALGRPRWGAAFEAGTLHEDLAWRIPPVLSAR